MTYHPLASVLIVDDDPVLCEVARSYFHESGASEIMLAQNGQEALDFVEQSEDVIDFILLDLKMPVMDGVQFLRHMDQRAYPGPIGIVSGEGAAISSLAIELAKKCGLNVMGPLAKPLSRACLDAMISKLGGTRHPAGNGSSPILSVEEIKAALNGHRIVAHYQPQIDAATGALSGVEALARLRHPERGILPPGLFIPQAEDNGLMPLLTEQMIRNVIADIETVNRADPGLTVSINLGAAALNDTAFPDSVASMVDQCGQHRSRFVFELTESKLVEDSVDSMEVLARLDLLGFELSLDDFGTQFSNIEQLTKFPFKELKIDQHFVRMAEKDHRSMATVASCVSLGKQLGMRIVAEGIETPEVWELMVSLGVDRLQGYQIAKPMPIDELIPWARSYQSQAGQGRIAVHM
ncbi:MAG: EAL domain-containing response regulator [Hyphomicrobiales bacterium]